MKNIPYLFISALGSLLFVFGAGKHYISDKIVKAAGLFLLAEGWSLFIISEIFDKID